MIEDDCEDIENKPKLGYLQAALRGSGGGLVGAIISFIFLNLAPKKVGGGLEAIGIGFAIAGIVSSSFVISLLIVGPIAGMLSLAIFKARSNPFLIGLLTQTLIEVAILSLLLYG